MSNDIGKGYVQVYTGNSKGKTTASLGLALRATCDGLNVYIGQFLKGQNYSELKAVDLLKPYLTIEQYGRPGFIHVNEKPNPEDYEMALAGYEKARQAMLSGDYDVVIFDEINVACYYKLLSEDNLLSLIKEKPDGVEIIFTGRYAAPVVIEAADLVTEMKEIKHYYNAGVKARKGIEK